MFFLKKEIIPLSAIVIAGLALAPAGASAFTLDAFSDIEGTSYTFGGVPFTDDSTLQQAIVNDNSPLDDIPTNTNTGLNDVFGGARTLQVQEVIDPASTGGNPVELVINQGISQVNFSAGSGTRGKAEIIYDGFDATNSGQNIKFVGGIVQRSIALTFDSLGINSGDLEFNFDLRDTSDNVLTLTRTFTDADNFLSSAGSRTEYFSFDGQSNETVAVGSADLTDIDYIRFYTSSENEADDFTFSFLATSEVPFEFSPGMGLLLGGGLFGWMKLRRKQKPTK